MASAINVQADNSVIQNSAFRQTRMATGHGSPESWCATPNRNASMSCNPRLRLVVVVRPSRGEPDELAGWGAGRCGVVSQDNGLYPGRK